MSLSKILTSTSHFAYFSRQERLSPVMVVLLTLLVGSTFTMRDLLVLWLGEWSHLSGVVEVSRIRWEELICYVPFAQSLLDGNWFAAAPLVDTQTNWMTVFPVISNIIYGLLLWLSGGSINVFMLLGHAVFPLLSFWLIYLVYRVFINKSWALMLAFLGVAYFSNFSSFGYFQQLLWGSEGWVSLASLDPPEITRMPFPGISFVLFAVVFYLTIKDNHLSLPRLVLLSVLWGLQVYVYPFNFMAGASFFLFWIVYASYTTQKRLDYSHLLRMLVPAIGIIIGIASPYLLSLLQFDNTGGDFLSRLNWAEGSQFFFSSWGILVGYLLPIGFVLATVYLFRADYYELVYKFTPIFIALVVDLLIGSSHLFFGAMISPELYQDRISGFMFRFLYFIPLIYFLSVPFKRSVLKRHEFWYQLREKLHHFLQRLLINNRYLICSTGVMLIAAIEWVGAYHQLQHHNQWVAPQMKSVERQIELANQLPKTSREHLVVFEEPAANLWWSATDANPSILVNGFGNVVSDHVIQERIFLFAALLGWDAQKLREFMSFSPVFLPEHQEQTIIRKDDLHQGLGNWLVNHHRFRSSEEVEPQLNQLEEAYRQVNPDQLLKKHPVSAIVASKDYSPAPWLKQYIGNIDSSNTHQVITLTVLEKEQP